METSRFVVALELGGYEEQSPLSRVVDDVWLSDRLDLLRVHFETVGFSVGPRSFPPFPCQGISFAIRYVHVGVDHKRILGQLVRTRKVIGSGLRCSLFTL